MNERSRQFGWAIVGVLVATVVLTLVAALQSTSVTVDAIRKTQKTNVKILKSQADVVEAIESCTTPGRKCFERSNRRTAKVVASINDVTILASACAMSVSPPTAEAIRTCIISQLPLKPLG